MSTVLSDVLMHALEEPHILFTFPSKTKRSDAHNKWRQLINRASPKNPAKLMTVTLKQRVCSKHSVGGEPSYEHPFIQLYVLLMNQIQGLRSLYPLQHVNKSCHIQHRHQKKQTSKTKKVDPNIESPCVSSIIASNGDINIDI
ncbi:uncharacterized protein LOC130644841 [Hydractinia symbiolongicarpus]|uniref:uncharacterized protein LOC130644841 n=1 Tax=Hydractinia symbiolongicarpus TaxID=13093 RepID=UPI00254A492E|nr:uncharacterized protein LOC130644841 [Hydractinia symbiolongicarpus]